MNDQEDHSAARALTTHQVARLDYARRDLETARAADLATLEPAALILIIERLRARLDDVLQLIDETDGA
ncbi:hypothetical protein ACIQNU_02175 [Streptomyces sp. NPDC091292]|uniref:hypothetical protein n=1 Tax=Streptomyces sp. NPDC091292 TaxID=3365991 RepID=UPI00380A893C